MPAAIFTDFSEARLEQDKQAFFSEGAKDVTGHLPEKQVGLWAKGEELRPETST
jgi:hypothetical protein